MKFFSERLPPALDTMEQTMASTHKAIGVLAPQLSGDYFGTLFAGIHAVTRRHDPRLIAVQGTPQDIFQLASAQVDGWIVINNADGIDTIAQAGAAIVSNGAPTPGVTAGLPAKKAGMRAAVAHLIAHQHQRIAFIGDLAHHDVKQRYAGYQAALAEHGIGFDPQLTFIVANSSEHSAAAALRQLLDSTLPCTAVAVATDESALGVLAAAQAAGLRVPEDLAVVGFDDIILAHSATPPLTTVRLPIYALGSTAAELLLAQIAGQVVPDGITHVPTALIPRRSCGCSLALPALAGLDAPGGHSWQERLVEQLAQLASAPLPYDPMIPLGAIWPGGQVLINALAATIQDTEHANPAALYQARQQLVERTQDLETLLAIMRLLEQAGARQLALAPDDAAAIRIDTLLAVTRLEMLRARLAPETAAIRSYAMLVHENHAISRTLLTADLGDVQQLAWLGQTSLSWGCLGLWDTAAGSDPAALVVAGSYLGNSQGGQPVAIGGRYTAALFPPDQLLPASVRTIGAEIAILLPIKTAAHDWGVLALAGPIQYLRSSGNYDALTALATLLGAALEREVLQQTLQNAYERERGLANIVRELGSPVIPLLPEVLLIPLVGVIDSLRAQQIMEAVLQGISAHQATTVLLDISGVPLVDTQVAHALLQATRAAGLLGARVILIGVRPEIAQSIVGLGINMHQFATQPTLAAAVQTLLKERGPMQRSGSHS
jgi:DNA-binding LacI/PurR family transcriptional regulator/anti-anti-sigma regulatory factor